MKKNPWWKRLWWQWKYRKQLVFLPHYGLAEADLWRFMHLPRDLRRVLVIDERGDVRVLWVPAGNVKFVLEMVECVCGYRAEEDKP